MGCLISWTDFDALSIHAALRGWFLTQLVQGGFKLCKQLLKGFHDVTVEWYWIAKALKPGDLSAGCQIMFPGNPIYIATSKSAT